MKLEDKATKVIRYQNAIKRSLKNKKVTLIKESEESFYLEILNLDKDFANEPCVAHKTMKGIVRVSALRMSRETFEALLINALQLLDMEDGESFQPTTNL